MNDIIREMDREQGKPIKYWRIKGRVEFQIFKTLDEDKDVDFGRKGHLWLHILKKIAGIVLNWDTRQHSEDQDNWEKKAMGLHVIIARSLDTWSPTQSEGNSNGMRSGVAEAATDIVSASDTVNEVLNENIWIGDIKVLWHNCNSNEGLYDDTTIPE